MEEVLLSLRRCSRLPLDLACAGVQRTNDAVAGTDIQGVARDRGCVGESASRFKTPAGRALFPVSLAIVSLRP